MDFNFRDSSKHAPRLGAPRLGAARLGTSQTRHQALSRPRHAGIFEAVHRLDAEMTAVTRAELRDWVKDQYEAEYGDFPLGFVALCRLGPPYVDHILDLGNSIVDHYAAADSMPAPFASGRMPIRTGAYEFVEVFGSGQVVAVRSDGSVVIL